MARASLFGPSFMRNIAPVAAGFIFGSLVSLVLRPTVQDLAIYKCARSGIGIDSHDRQSNSRFVYASASELKKYGTPGTTHSRIQNRSVLDTAKSKSAATSSKMNAKVTRPRFSATELGIKDKLLVGVITSRENLATIAAAINKTVAHHISKLVFFVEAPVTISPSSASPRYLNIINIAAGTPDNLKPFAVLNHMAGRGHALASNYDWFFFMPDSVYLKAFKLFELVSHMSFGYDVQIGRPWFKSSSDDASATVPTSYCDFNAGILISFGLMRSILANLRQCMKNVDPGLATSENFGRCILSTNDEAVCSEEWNGKLYRSWPLAKGVQIARDLSELGKQDSFNGALTVFPVITVSDIFHLHKYYCNQEIEQINQLIGVVEQNLFSSANYNGSNGISWPAGIPAESRPRSRYELLKWDYFDSVNIFESNNDLNVRKLSGVNEKDVKEVVDYVAKTLVRKYPVLKFNRLVSGYRRFDPKRGMEYVVDLSFSGDGVEEEIRKRVRLIRPLNRVELIAAPYVTEATRVVIAVSVSPNENVAARAFLDRFSRVCFDVNENAKLIFVLFYTNAQEQNSYKELVNAIASAKKKYGVADATALSVQGQLDYVYLRAKVPSSFLLMDLMLQTVGHDHLYLIVSPWVEVYVDFLNRVRMNTIKEFQTFFPIPFAQFNPKIVYRKKSGAAGSTPEHIEVHKDVGRFDRYDYNVGSFYGSDYYVRRKMLGSDDGERLYYEYDLLSIFLNSTLHILRAVEPALKIRYHQKWCRPQLRNDLYSRCSWSNKEGLGTKSQLAKLLMEYGAINDSL